MATKQPLWQLHEAKGALQRAVRRVRTQGPQRVVKQRGEAVVIVSAEEFDRASERARQPASAGRILSFGADRRSSLDLARKRRHDENA